MEKRTKYWGSIAYVESIPTNWLSILESTHIPILISPLHDRDILEDFNNSAKKDNQVFKKPHYHIILMFDSLKTREQAKEIFNLIQSVGCERIMSIRGYSRYLTHLDNPNKAQYNPEKIIELSGANYQSLIQLPQDRYAIIKEIINYCCKNDIDSFAEILEYSLNNRHDWFITLVDGYSLVLISYLKSRSWTKHKDR